MFVLLLILVATSSYGVEGTPPSDAFNAAVTNCTYFPACPTSGISSISGSMQAGTYEVTCNDVTEKWYFFPSYGCYMYLQTGFANTQNSLSLLSSMDSNITSSIGVINTMTIPSMESNLIMQIQLAKIQLRSEMSQAFNYTQQLFMNLTNILNMSITLQQASDSLQLGYIKSNEYNIGSNVNNLTNVIQILEGNLQSQTGILKKQEHDNREIAIASIVQAGILALAMMMTLHNSFRHWRIRHLVNNRMSDPAVEMTARGMSTNSIPSYAPSPSAPAMIFSQPRPNLAANMMTQNLV